MRGSDWRKIWAALRELGADVPDWEEPDPERQRRSLASEERITTTVDIRSVLPRKREALFAHDSQIGGESWFSKIPEDIAAATFGRESFIRASDTTGAPLPEDDKKRGLNPAFHPAVAEILRNYEVIWGKELAQLASAGMMGQALSGFHQALLGRDVTLPRVMPDPARPWAADAAAEFRDDVVAALFDPPGKDELMGERLAPQVREDEAAATEIACARGDLRVGDVDADPRLVGRALAQEEVGAPRVRHELLGPRRVAGVEDRASLGLDAEAEGAQLARVRHGEGQHPHPVQRGARARHQLLVAHGEGERLGGDALVQGREQGAHPRLRARRPVHRERTRARLLEAVLHEEEGQAPEVIAVEVREKDEVHRAWVAAAPLERLQDGRPAVEEEGVARGLDQVSAV